MKKGRNYTISERAIIAIGIKAGKSLHEINKLLSSEQKKNSLSQRALNPSSYDMVRKKYLPSMDDKGMWDYIMSPKTLSQLAGE
jgi:hypothetical protein